MKLRVPKSTSAKVRNRMKKKIRIRKTVKGTSERPRLCVFRSAKHIYAQVINDDAAQTILTVSSLSLEAKVTGKELAKTVGKENEAAKISICNIRRDAIEALKKAEKNKEITEDELRTYEKKVQESLLKTYKDIFKLKN